LPPETRKVFFPWVCYRDGRLMRGGWLRLTIDNFGGIEVGRGSSLYRFRRLGAPVWPQAIQWLATTTVTMG
jgi:hypothetical protein